MVPGGVWDVLAATFNRRESMTEPEKPQQESATVMKLQVLSKTLVAENRNMGAEVASRAATELEASEQNARNLAEEVAKLKAEVARLDKVIAIADAITGGLDRSNDHLRECLKKTEEKLAEYAPPFTDESRQHAPSREKGGAA